MTNEDANTLISEVQKTRPGIARLARLLSIAVRVDAALLRRMRLRLAPELDVGVEADLWFSPLVESRGSTGFVLEKEVAALLRQSLVSEPGLLQQVEQALREERGDLQPSILMEEQITALALAGASVTEMEEALRPAVLAIVDEERGTEVARWVMRALPRLPPEVLKTEAAMMLSLGASARLGDRPVLTNADSETALPSWMTWALPKERLAEHVQIGVRGLKEGIEFLIPSNGAKTTLELPRTEPLWLSISWQSGGQTFAQTVHVKPGRIVPLPENVSELTLRTLGGDGYQMEFLGPAADSDTEKATCFVVMGFGKKTDWETGRVLDLDQSYQSLIKPAVEAAGLKCIRADEIVHSGLIDVPMYEMLLKADVVVADLSTSNRNAIYQLGVRHALRPYTTIIIAEEMMLKSPTFDLSHLVIRKYRHLGEDIGVSEAERFTTELTAAIQNLLATEPELRTDSPVYKFIDGLIPPSIAAEVPKEKSVMPVMELETEKGTCFVVMGFGKKTDFETGRVLDLDRSYLDLIKPMVEAAGLKCVRADEIVHSGLIDVPMYEMLLKAEVVVADLSTSNRNAIYQLGVRHALRPYTTIIIAEDTMMKSPIYDLQHIVIRQYHHLGEDIGSSEARRFTTSLTAAIKEIMATDSKLRGDSPVYEFIKRLTPPSISTGARAARAVAGLNEYVAGAATPVHRELMQRVDEAQRKGDWIKAKILLEEIREMRRARVSETSAGQQVENPEDPDVLQRLALATYKSKSPTPEEALKAARDLLKLLEPQTTNDTETLGLWGSVHKRLWDLTKESSYLDEAVRAYERGFYRRNDYYNGINYAYMLNERAAVNTVDSAQAEADFMQARRVRKEVISICHQWLESNAPTASLPPESKLIENRYWVLSTLAEAYYGLGEDDVAQQRLEEAYAIAPSAWMNESTQYQLDKLRVLLANSPIPPPQTKHEKPLGKSELDSALDQVSDESVTTVIKEFQDLLAQAKDNARELIRQNAKGLEQHLLLLKKGQISMEEFHYFVENQKRDLRVFVDSQPAQAQERAEKLTLQVLELAATKVVPVLIRPV